MTDILQAVGGTMLICIPISLLLTIILIPSCPEMFTGIGIGDFFRVWLIAYILSLLFAAAAFVGVVGVSMLVGAFR